MMEKARGSNTASELIQTGISGLDEILGGGFPRDKVILLVGGPGCGKSVFSMEFILRGVERFQENGVYCSFEETTDDLVFNAESFGWDMQGLLKNKKVTLSSIDVQPDQNVEVGNFNLDALFVRIDLAIKKVGAKRLVLDGIHNLLTGFSNEKIIRMEVIRLLRWLKEKEVSVIITGEKGTDSWSKFGFEEYLCDGLISLNNTIDDNFTTRHLRVVKCRGVNHGMDLYPFLIGTEGLEIVPVLSADFDYEVPSGEYISTGVAGLDEMFASGGYSRGSTVLVTGTSGTGKSSLAAAFLNGACERGEKAIYFAFEESAEQIIRNMRSIGIDLEPWIKKGLLKIVATRSTVAGLEGHLVKLKNQVQKHGPAVAVIDPITAFIPVAQINQIKLMLIRLNDYLRSCTITSLFTSLSNETRVDELSDVSMSSLADTWIALKIKEDGNQKDNTIEIKKSRGMQHNKQIHEMHLSNKGIVLEDLYMGPSGLLAGAAKAQQMILDREEDARVSDQIRTLENLIEKKKILQKQQMDSISDEAESEITGMMSEIRQLKKQLKFKEIREEKVEASLNANGAKD